MSLLWKNAPTTLMNNFIVVKEKSENLQNNFEKLEWIVEKYKYMIQDQLSKGINRVDECSRDQYGHFMPHRCFVRNDKGSKKAQ
ncbi:hypothetical protein TNIN_196421 [Trichonephila inaurata madagascariensis]|uniref:Uncharacterized protein n=1 Tax=Trichonephila inaurata madagascariensis TaxID=2747483 RepID=A0A8X6YHL1_9ARAC|nr:hypothetical protein TNIN_196421 [Trichonephila inaurata madagascariensis]